MPPIKKARLILAKEEDKIIDEILDALQAIWDKHDVFPREFSVEYNPIYSIGDTVKSNPINAVTKVTVNL